MAPALPAENADVTGGVGDPRSFEPLETRRIPEPLPTSRGSAELRPPLPFCADHGPIRTIAARRLSRGKATAPV
jgi:hypothetical protein